MKSESGRIPSGWKRRDNGVFCGECWRKQFVLRAVSVPVASPLDLNWDEFGAILRENWALVTQASNWMLTEMYIRDDRSREDGKLRRMPKVYLYPDARRIFSALPTQTLASLEQAVGKKYRAKRYETVWTFKSSLPTYRYPTPFPVPNQGWSVEIKSDFAVVSMRIGDARRRFRLRGGHQFRRQMEAIKAIVAGSAEPGQMDLYRQGDKVMCKMVAWLPRTGAESKADGVLFARTDAEALIVALNAKDERLWTYHGDQARRWTAEHAKRLQRWADDSKAEHRPVPPFAERRNMAVRKHRQRMATLTHQVAAMLVNYAVRRKFAAIAYDDSIKSFCETFPWFELRAKIADKANVAGIELQAVKAAGADGTD